MNGWMNEWLYVYQLQTTVWTKTPMGSNSNNNPDYKCTCVP